MASIRTISLDDETNKKLNEIQKKFRKGIVSKIVKNAIEEFYLNNLNIMENLKND